jgi:hypothetical protein
VLRDYQLHALDDARQNIRAGRRRQILCAPTGAGKIVIALGLMQAAMAAGARSAFVADRSALIDQASVAMELYGIDHRIKQAARGVGTGEFYARRTGLPWAMPPEAGTDANDFHLGAGLPALQALLLKLMQGRPLARG